MAHLALAEAAVHALHLDRVDLIVSQVALAKEAAPRPRFEDRLAVLDAAARARPWMGVRVTSLQLLADIAGGYGCLVLGADKWEQVLDPIFYGGSAVARDAAVASLPRLAVARRSGTALPSAEALPPGSVVLDVGDHLADVSSTGARSDAGLRHWMAPEAEAFDARSGAWSDPRRYDAWLAGGPQPASPG